MTRLCLAILLAVPAFLGAQPFQWTTFTSTSNTVDILELDGDIWTASSGGVTRFDPSTGEFEVYTNTRGLAMNAATALGADDRGWIWIGFQDGRITRLNPSTGQVKQIIALQGQVFNMNRILTVNDDVYIAAENGIYRFVYNPIPDNYIVRESILVLGSFPNQIEVQDIAYSEGHLYAATASGLARADASNDLLSAPAAWENFSESNSDLPDDNVTELYAMADGTLLLAVSNFTCRYDGNEFIEVLQQTDVVEFAESPAGLFLATSTILFQHVNGQWQAAGEIVGSMSDFVILDVDGESQLIAGVRDNVNRSGGLALFDTELEFEIVRASSTGGNLISHVNLQKDGRLWVLAGDLRKTVSNFDGVSWSVFGRDTSSNPGFFGNGPQNMVEDNQGGVWISSQGGGLLWISEDDTVQFNDSDSSGFDNFGPRLSLAVGDPGFIITRVERDSQGNVWITNRIESGGRGPALIRVPASWIALGNNSTAWEYFYPEAEGNSNPTQVEELIADPLDRLWLGSPGNINGAAYVLEHPGAVNDSSDDEWFTYDPVDFEDATTCFPEIHGGVLTWAIDQQNYLWVGTITGAYYLQGGLPGQLTNNMRFICLFDIPIGTQINDIHVDSQDNKWFATDEGVAVLDRNFTWIHIFQDASSVDNASLLTSNSVTSITSNPRTGVFWIGTQDGLSRLQTPYLTRDKSLDEVWPYPNPFRADGSQRMYIDEDRLGGRFDEARIFTITGRLVRELSWSEMISTGWDGRNEDNDLVAAGVYLVVTSSADGNSATGKVAVLGR